MIYSDTAPATLYGIKQDIYFLAHCNNASIPDGDLNRIINKYYLQLQEAVRSVNEDFYLVQAVANLVSGDGTYSFPDGTGTAPAYEKMKSIWAAFLPADRNNPQPSEYQRVTIVDPESITDPAYVFSTPTALMYGTYLVLLPLASQIPQATFPIINGLKMNYVSSNSLLVNPTDTPLIFSSFHDAITQGALIDVAERLGDKSLKADSIKLFAKRLEDIRSYASAHLPDLAGIVEGQDEAGGWDFPFGQQSMS